MDIGASILTRFVRGGNKDLLCKYIGGLTALEIITDLRSDPDDPFQWKEGQTGQIHRKSWLDNRRRVLWDIWNCVNVNGRQAFFSRMLRFAVLLNYTDIATELIALPLDDAQNPGKTREMIDLWNVLYGPFRGTAFIQNPQIIETARDVVMIGVVQLFQQLLDLYGNFDFTPYRRGLAVIAIFNSNLSMLKFLFEKLGKPATVLLIAAGYVPPLKRNDTKAADVFRFVLTQYKLEDVDELVKNVVLSRSGQRFAALPDHIQQKYAEEVAHKAFYTGANELLQEALVWVDGAYMEYIFSGGFVQPEHIVDPVITEEEIDAVVKTVVNDHKFNPEYDLDLTIVPLHDRLVMKAFLRHHELYEEIIREGGGDSVFFTRDLLDKLLEKWQNDVEVVAMLKKIRYFVPRSKEKSPSDLRKDLTSIDLNNRTVMKGLLRDYRVYENISRETLDELIEIWRNDGEVSEMLKDILRRRFQRPQVEGEPPAKLLKDPATASYYV